MTEPNNSVLIKSIIINIDNHFKGQKSNKVSPLVRANYTAFKNWLEKYNPKSGATDMEKVQGYIEALYHSCKLELWEPIKIILSITTSTNKLENLTIPLSEYLIIKGLSIELIRISQDAIDSFRKTKNNISLIYLLKARALFSINKPQEASDLIRDTYQYFSHDLEIFAEALAFSGKCQLHSGNYKEAFQEIKKSLFNIEAILSQNTNSKLLGIKADVLDNLALYEMNKSQPERALTHFSESAKIYQEILDFDKSNNQFFAKKMFPLGHQGIIYRKICNSPFHVFPFTKLIFCRLFKKSIMCTPIEENHELAAQRLSEAALIANKFQYDHGFLWATHHLAWVYLDQGNIAQAEEQCKIALEGNIRMDTRRGIADCYEQWGVINLAKGSKYITLAEENLEKSLNIRKSVNNPHGVASSLTYLALASSCDKLYIKALKLIVEACLIYYKIGVLNITRLIRIITLFYSWLIRNKTLTM